MLKGYHYHLQIPTITLSVCCSRSVEVRQIAWQGLAEDNIPFRIAGSSSCEQVKRTKKRRYRRLEKRWIMKVGSRREEEKEVEKESGG